MNVTTIVAIVALVSLLVIVVVVISSWRQGNKSRNASIKAIEQSINDVAYELSEMNATWKKTNEQLDELRDLEKRKGESEIPEAKSPVEKGNEPFESPAREEISLDFADLDDFDSLGFEDIELLESMEGIYTEYNTGRSGKKYTAEELESLIKE